MKLELNRKMNRTGFFPRFLHWAVCGAAVILSLCIAYGSVAQKQIADSIVRLHIIANSDDAADQELKLKVRDAVIAHMQDKYPEGASCDEAVDYLQKSLPEIRQVAERVLRENGSEAEVEARYGVYPFPTRTYDNITLPAGMYQSVRIELGEAKGQNWWCVMFPPLCIANDHTLQMSQESQEQLQATLGNEGYRLITEVNDTGNTEVQVKFRIVEWVQESRLRLAELISSLF